MIYSDSSPRVASYNKGTITAASITPAACCALLLEVLIRNMGERSSSRLVVYGFLLSS